MTPAQGVQLMDWLRGNDPSTMLVLPMLSLAIGAMLFALLLGILRPPDSPTASDAAGTRPRSPGNSPGSALPFRGRLTPQGSEEGGTGSDPALPVPVERVAHKEPPPRGWVVPSLVPHGPRPRWRLEGQWPFLFRERKGYVTTVVAEGGTGKSFLGLDLSVAATTDGGTWLGHTVERLRSVLYVDCELDSDTFWSRAYAVARGRGLTHPPGHLPWWALHRQVWAWWKPQGIHYLRLPRSLATFEAQVEVWQAVKRYRAELVLVDSLTIGARGLALSDQNGWNRVLSGFEWWGKPVVCIDHLGKDADKGAVGSFMKQAMIRSGLSCTAGRDGTITVRHTKANFGPKLEPFRVTASFTGGQLGGPPLTVTFAALASVAGIEPAPSRATGGDAAATPHGTVPSLTPLPLPVLTPAPPDVRGPGKWDALVLAIYQRHAPDVVDPAEVAKELSCALQTVRNALSRLKRTGAVANPAPKQWRAAEKEATA